MRIKSLLFLSLAVLIFFPVISNAYFSRSLSLGSVGLDVKELQVVLNSDSDTQIASFGVGSPGSESMYFGNLTKNAVIRYQNKYKNEVLSPAGLAYGTGFVGKMTLNKLNAQSNQQVIPQLSPVTSPNTPVSLTPTQNTANNITKIDKVDIYTTDRALSIYKKRLWDSINSAVVSQSKPDLSKDVNFSYLSITGTYISNMNKSVVKPGDTMSVGGYGFTRYNTIYINGEYTAKIKTQSSSMISFEVPNIPYGRYDIAVKNSNGISQTAVMVVTPDGESTVKVTGKDPENVSYGETITIKGTGFTSTGNEIRTTYGNVLNVSSSDGKNLSFQVTPEFLRETVKVKTFNQLYPVQFIVVNANGVSSPAQFTVRY